MNTPEQVKPRSSGLPVATNVSPPDSIDVVGSDIGKYHVVRKLGEGGMGAVFEAVHSEIGQRAAIKVLHAHLTQQPKFVKRFVDEARLIGMVGHPGLVKVYDFTTTSTGAHCIVMEFLVGESLWSRCNRGKEKGATGMVVSEALLIARQVASALSTVHGRGITHRDLKPENIMLVADPDTPSGERAKILDFGIARLEDPESGERQTTSGVSLGTPTYMAPEQIEGLQNPTDRIDVYALGVILFELLCGEPPFQSATTGGVLRQHLIKAPPPLPPHVPAEVQALVHSALAKEPTARPSMAQLVERLDALQGSGRFSNAALHVVLPLSVEVPIGARSPRLRMVYVGAVALVALAIVVVVMLFVRRPPAAPTGQTPALPQTTQPLPSPPIEAPVPVKANPPPVAKPARGEVRLEPPNAPKKTTPKGEGKPRGSKGLRFGDLPRTSGK